ncbi:MAG: ChbG/HpnK family deacetylase [Xanthobacteraceae bacterium]
MSHQPQRHIILCADDYGISPAVSGAIRDLIAKKRINATSVMVTAPTFSHAEAAALREAAGNHAAIGLHLTLTAPFRPHGHGFAPLRDGAFPALASMARRGLSRSLTPALLDAEIAGQFAAFRSAFGRAPDYVDGHQHIHVFPQISEALLRVTKHTAPHAWLRQCGRAVRKTLEPKGLVLDALSRRFRRLAAEHGLPTNPAFAGTYAFRARADYAKLFPDFLDGMPDGGVIMCHPGVVDAELARLDPLTDLREREYAYFLDDAFAQLLQRRGYGLA